MACSCIVWQAETWQLHKVAVVAYRSLQFVEMKVYWDTLDSLFASLINPLVSKLQKIKSAN